MKKAAGQFFRFGIVGLVTNLTIYICYLMLTHMGMGHKSSMTLLYILGTFLGYTLNRNWTFTHRGRIHSSFVNYVLLYLIGYLLNYAGLVIFVDVLELDHRLVQGVLILIVAMVLFLGQKYLVFRIS